MLFFILKGVENVQQTEQMHFLGGIPIAGQQPEKLNCPIAYRVG